MTEKAKILGVTVTHNGSQFVELMLRTLFATNDLSGFNFEMNVLDNKSAPTALPALSEYLTSHGISLTATGGRYYVAAEQHGAALTDFIARRPDPTHYLFLDADMWFIEPNTIGTMLTELM